MPGPIFIVGAMGSGTTLVRLVLDSHENIAIPRETGFMRGYNAIRFTPFKWYGNWTRQIGWKRRELDEVMRELYDRLFMRYAERLGKTRWGEKSPLHTWHLGDMARLFPDAQFVGVVRHPAASVASNVDRFERTGIRTARLHWNRNTHEIVRNAALLGDRFAMIRYEDLVLRPEALLRELLDWLGEPWSDAVLRHHDVVPSREGRAREVEGWTRTDDPIDTSRVSKWTQTMPARDRASLRRRMSDRAAFFGYSMDRPEPVAPFAAEGRLILLGSELDARIDEFPDLDLRRPREPPVTDILYKPRDAMILRRAVYDELMAWGGARGLGLRFAERLPQERRMRLTRFVGRVRKRLRLARR